MLVAFLEQNQEHPSRASPLQRSSRAIPDLGGQASQRETRERQHRARRDDVKQRAAGGMPATRQAYLKPERGDAERRAARVDLLELTTRPPGHRRREGDKQHQRDQPRQTAKAGEQRGSPSRHHLKHTKTTAAKVQENASRRLSTTRQESNPNAYGALAVLKTSTNAANCSCSSRQREVEREARP